MFTLIFVKFTFMDACEPIPDISKHIYDINIVLHSMNILQTYIYDSNIVLQSMNILQFSYCFSVGENAIDFNFYYYKQCFFEHSCPYLLIQISFSRF